MTAAVAEINLLIPTGNIFRNAANNKTKTPSTKVPAMPKTVHTTLITHEIESSIILTQRN